jgi:hypothetical protein
MVPLTELWMPLAAAAVLVFVASSIIHMALPYHRADYKRLPNEDEVADAIRRGGAGTGYYTIPWCSSMKESSTPEFQEKYRRGPVALIAKLPDGMPNMGKFLGLWFVQCVIVSLFAVYVTSRTLGAGSDYLMVFRVAGTVAFAGYGLGNITDSIWRGQPWSNTFRALFDALVYAGVTGGTCGWLWPR